MKKKYKIDKQISIHDLRKNNRKKEGKTKKRILLALITIITVCILGGEEFTGSLMGFMGIIGLISFLLIIPLFFIGKTIFAAKDKNYKVTSLAATILFSLGLFYAFTGYGINPIGLLVITTLPLITFAIFDYFRLRKNKKINREQ